MNHRESKQKMGRGFLVACAVGFGLMISMAASVGLRADAARKNASGQNGHRMARLEEALASTLPKIGYFSFDGASAPRQDGKGRDGSGRTPDQARGVRLQSNDMFDITNKLISIGLVSPPTFAFAHHRLDAG